MQSATRVGLVALVLLEIAGNAVGGEPDGGRRPPPRPAGSSENKAAPGQDGFIGSANGVVVAMANQSRRRRRRRPIMRKGNYKVTEVVHGGRIEGTVIYHGPIPEPERIQIVKDHETCDRRSKKRNLLQVSPQHQVAGVVVFLGDIHQGKAIPKRPKPTITQRSCTFVPHIQVLYTKEAFDLVNEDPVAHNAKCAQSMMTLFNPMQPKQGMRNEFAIKRPGLATITCAVHNWMRAYAYVLWHPYYAITETDGAFVIEDIPPGEYELVAWQEHLGERSTKVTVEADKTTRIEFDLSPES